MLLPAHVPPASRRTQRRPRGDVLRATRREAESYRRNTASALPAEHGDGGAPASARRVLELVRQALERRQGCQGHRGSHRRWRPAHWIDYRVTLDTGELLHFHVVAHGDYDTGVFAYNLVRRGERYGMRIVGSLKSQPAL